jgi:hypothetical protein
MAGQHDDLIRFGRLQQNLLHPTEPAIIGVHKRIVEDDWRLLTVLAEKIGEGEAG